MSEFDLIKKYFTRPATSALLGIGDDAALVVTGRDNALVISSDMLVSGTHFFADADPFQLGHKTLAVNLSDMAAMGATPRWATLAIALPDINETWLERFSAGFFSLARLHGVELIGGDTTRGPLNLCVTIFGEMPGGQALRRSGAQVDDEIWVSGNLGDAALALAHLQKHLVLSEAEFAVCASALHQPTPRIGLGLNLRGIASSAIDVSDGLLADLGHVLRAANVGAQLEFSRLPISPTLKNYLQQPLGRLCALAGGDDYELCFTAAPAHHEKIVGIGVKLALPLTRIGKIVAGSKCIVLDAAGAPITIESTGYAHF